MSTRLRFVQGWLGLLLAGLGLAATAQTPVAPVYQDSRYTGGTHKTGPQPGNRVALDLPAPMPLTPAPRVDTASLYVRLDLGENYAYGDVDFKATVKFSLAAEGTSTVSLCGGCGFTLTAKKPEALYFRDIKAQVGGDRIALVVDSVKVTVNHVNATVKARLESKIRSELRVGLDYRIGYGINVRNVNLAAGNVVVRGKVATFHWNKTFAPNHEFQLVRLHNKLDPNGAGVDPVLKEKLLSGEAIVSGVDWSKALSLETGGSNNSLKLTLAEGSGYYAWRVRPVGTWAEGGIASGANHGAWSGGALAVPAAINTRSTPNTLPNDEFGKPLAAFYFTDPDEKINNLYSRTFTEGNRVSEKITYATELQQVKQTQTYLPSQKAGVTTQTVYDHSNRPALTTLPVPTRDSLGLGGYKQKFVKPAGRPDTSRAYHAGDFDGDANFRKPAPVKGNGTPFSYYTGKNNVPDAEGYPFSRNLYYHDGTDRVKEQSGVGRTHMIGDSTGMGKTVKTYFGTASQLELVRLFGDEAPNGKSVLKTITVDQNNTATVNYTSKEGKVIATSMAFHQPDKLLAVSDDNAGTTITDQVTDNTTAGGAIVSSKRVAFIGRTPLDITYQMDTCNSTLQDCNRIKADCRYELRVLVQKIDGEKFSTRSTDSNYVAIGTTASLKGWTLLAGGTILISTDTTVSCSNRAGLTFNRLTLPQGTYVVEKQLIPRGGAVVVEAAGEKIDAQIKPLSNMIKAWLDEVTCDKAIDGFYAKLRKLEFRIDSVKAICRGNASRCGAAFKGLDNLYASQGLAVDSVFFNADHDVAVFPRSGPAQQVTLTSTCCGNLVIPIDYTPAFAFDQVALRERAGVPNPGGVANYYTVNPFLFTDSTKTEFFPDFEGYAFNYFWDCTPTGPALTAALAGLGAVPPSIYQGDVSMYNGDTTLTATQKSALLAEARNKIKFIYHKILNPYMSGWGTPGTFNLMAHHMLTDQYPCDGTSADPPAPGVDPCTGTSTTVCTTVNGKKHCVQYNAGDLFNCWVAQLGYLKDNLGLCPNPTDASFAGEDQTEPPYRVSDGIDSENKGDGGKHDDHVDSGMKGGFITKWFAKRKVKKLSKRLRTMQGAPDPDGEGGDISDAEKIAANFKYHLVKEFLDCTGYRFAKVLTNAPAGEAAPLAGDVEPGFSYVVPAAPLTGAVTYKGQDRGYRPHAGWQATASGDPENLFPAVKDPVYAFKYFQYKDGSRPEVEIATCYRDPNRCYVNGVEVPCCPGVPDELCNFCGIGKVKCQVTKKDWNCGQRFTFFELLRNMKDSERINWSDDGLVCDDYLAPGYVEAGTFYTWENGQTYTGAAYETLKNNNFVVNGQRLKSKVEVDLAGLNRGLAGDCEGKRATYRQTLIDTFKAKGYVLADCKASATDNIVPWADVDTLVNVLVRECRQRGLVTTFACLGDSCRDIYAPSTIVGHVDTNGVRINYNRLEYGVESVGNATCGTTLLHYRPVMGDTLLTAGADTLKAPSSYGSGSITIRDCNGSTFTYCEWTKRREVSEMALKIDIPPYQDPTYKTLCQTNPGPGCPPATAGNPEVHDHLAPGEANPGAYVPKKLSAPVGVTVKMSKSNGVTVNSGQ